ncbi:hypothetical protein SAMN05446037_102469 [Anaerovirgula multivorans]|uniref:Uncharacterized protein n=1 Tax=Anaerovirgula multivorans TaxID=312168 RepID=A0A239HYQ9_9FIRM|nr:hypothetical protein [Anaerovirgula multivorans]SNS86455.1 hypothetical protein SAMN05446037_102469 [Anaerovirgula multivorans]
MAGYHTGYGNIIGQAIGARHSHLDNAGYSIDQENESFTKQEIVEKLIEEEINKKLKKEEAEEILEIYIKEIEKKFSYT